MKRAWTVAGMVVMASVIALAQQMPDRRSDSVRLEAAINKEVIDGDLVGAMEVYRALTESAERPVRAQAMLRLGQGYKRTGNPQATATLERALEFTDLPAVVTGARAALGRTEEQAAAGSVRTLVVKNRSLNLEYPAISPDGRLLAYTDYDGEANVAIRDLTTGLTRLVTADGAAPGREAYYKAFSKDGRWLAYRFDYQDTSELRVIDLSAPGLPGPSVLVSHTNRAVTPYDWSANGQRLAVQVTGGRQTEAQVGYLTIADRQFHVVRTIQWLGSSRVALSPDGAYLAYDNRAEDTGERDVFIVSADGKVEAPIARHRGNDTVVGWSVDGRYLLFLSEKDGARGLYSQAIRGGRPNGNAALLRENVAGTPVGLTSAGDVVFEVDPSTEAFFVADFDRASLRVTPTRTKPVPGLRPDWVANTGTVAHAVERSRAVLAVTTPATGRTREMTLAELQYIQDFSVNPDGQSVITKGAGVQSGAGLFRVDLRSGTVTPVVQQTGQPKPEIWTNPVWWRGTSSIAYSVLRTNFVGRLPGIREAGPDEPRFVERDLSTGEVRQLVSFGKEPWNTSGLAPSPDRRFLAAQSPARGQFLGAGGGPYATDKNSYLNVHTLASGESRRLWQAPFPRAFAGQPQWLPDSSALIVSKYSDDSLSRLEAWFVPLDGSSPRKLDLGVLNLQPGLRLSPDGRQLLITIGDVRDGEVQSIERIVPGSRR